MLKYIEGALHELQLYTIYFIYQSYETSIQPPQRIGGVIFICCSPTSHSRHNNCSCFLKSKNKNYQRFVFRPKYIFTTNLIKPSRNRSLLTLRISPGSGSRGDSDSFIPTRVLILSHELNIPHPALWHCRAMLKKYIFK